MTTVTITGATGATYTLTVDRGGRATGCTCPAATYHGPNCKHQRVHNTRAARVTPATRSTLPTLDAGFWDPLSLMDENDAA